MGLGMNATGWWRTIPALARVPRARASTTAAWGGLSASPGPYTVAEMADDAVSVLDAAGVEAAHVYGISLGGMIAQEVALRHPARVRALVLGATTRGGDGARAGLRRRRSRFVRLRAQMTAEHAVWASVPINYARAHPRRGRRPDRRGHRAAPALPGRGRVLQRAARGRHGHDARVEDIRAPTLVVHGAEDVLIPPANGERLAARHPRRRAVDVAAAPRTCTSPTSPRSTATSRSG